MTEYPKKYCFFLFQNMWNGFVFNPGPTWAARAAAASIFLQCNHMADSGCRRPHRTRPKGYKDYHKSHLLVHPGVNEISCFQLIKLLVLLDKLNYLRVLPDKKKCFFNEFLQLLNKKFCLWSTKTKHKLLTLIHLIKCWLDRCFWKAENKTLSVSI